VTHAQDERRALSDLLADLGPGKPTLCTGWQTSDLAAHLVLRERRPDAGAGVMGGPLAGYTRHVQARLASRNSFAELLKLIRTGPPRMSLFGLPGADDRLNLVEYFVHHEDVRRGGGDNTARTDAEGVRIEDALWQMLHRGAKFMTRTVKTTGIDLVRPDGDVIHARPGAQVATITGTASEIVLFLSGRGEAAHVELGGPDTAVAAVRGAGFGI
jgi:uncharacterized protein (TIGR03085 family)